MGSRTRLAAVAAGIAAVTVAALLTHQYLEIQEASRRVTFNIREMDEVPAGVAVVNITDDHLSRLPPHVAHGFRTAAEVGFARIIGMTREELMQTRDVLEDPSLRDTGPLYRYKGRVLSTWISV